MDLGPDERPWLVEFKLRGALLGAGHPVLAAASLDAWGARPSHGITPVGVLVDERLNLAPAPPRIVRTERKAEGIKGMTVSHATDQATTVDDYLAACREYDTEANPSTTQALHQRQWQRGPDHFPRRRTRTGRP